MTGLIALSRTGRELALLLRRGCGRRNGQRDRLPLIEEADGLLGTSDHLVEAALPAFSSASLRAAATTPDASGPTRSAAATGRA